jgi:uncharacterized zinc-type alcohol dehydrogenase-like protein
MPATSRSNRWTSPAARPAPHDVQIDIAYCGVCHSDLHRCAPNGPARLPLRAGPRDRRPRAAVGADVSVQGRRPGRRRLHGRQLPALRRLRGRPGALLRRHDRHLQRPRPQDAPGHTLGGYSQQIVVHERYVLRSAPPEKQLAAVAPLLCAGITTYSPLRHWKAGSGQEGRRRRHRRPGPHGHQAGPRHGRARGAFTTSESKRRGRQALGAREVVVSRNETPWPRTETAST